MTRRTVALLALSLLLAAACGRSNTTTASSTPPTNGGTVNEANAMDRGAFGDLGVVCKKASDPSALKATDIGVTASEIHVTTFSDPGYAAVKGLNQELFDTATAFSNWCNEHGGINGRQIKVTLADGKLFEAEQRMVEACDAKTFMAVGGGNVFDDTMQKDRLACKSGAIPQVAGYLVTAIASDSDLTILPSPNPLQRQGVGMFRWLKQHYPDAMQHVGVLTGAIPTTQIVAQRNEEALRDVGATLVYHGEYPPAGTDNWRPYVAAMQSKGVRGLYWVGQPAGLAQMLSSARGLGLHLDWISAETNHYDPVLFSTANPVTAVDGVYVNSALAPILFGDAKRAPATKEYVDIVNRYAGASKKIAALGDTAFSAWLLWAKAADSCGANLTRDCMWAALLKVHEWTGGGLHAKSDPGRDQGSSCFMLFQAKNGKFIEPDVDANTGIYNCSPDNVVTLKKDYGHGARCPNPAYRTDPKPSTCGSAKG
jgi:ABC-type branched-subunit amino acid transport system substrate-binding protein